MCSIALQIRPDFLSALARDPVSEQDRGEIHWGYVVVSCPATLQETVCDVRSGDVPSLLSLPSSYAGHTQQAHPGASSSENHRAASREAREEVVLRQTAPGASLSSSTWKQTAVPLASGVYFAKGSVDFGSVVVGSLRRMKATLCNATDTEVSTQEDHD